MKMNIIVNGKSTEVESQITLAKYLASVNINHDYVAIALNGTLISQTAFQATILGNGDQLEIVRPAGGGQNTVTIFISN